MESKSIKNVKNFLIAVCDVQKFGTHILNQYLHFLIFRSHLTLNTAQQCDGPRPLTPSDILTDCIYSDNYSLCIICTNNHLIISHLRVKSVLFRLHPLVISSFIQTHVTSDSDSNLFVKFMRRKATAPHSTPHG